MTIPAEIHQDRAPCEVRRKRQVRPTHLLCGTHVAGVDDDPFEHQAVEIDGGDIVCTFEPVAGSVHLRANGALERHVRDLEGSLAVVVPPRLRMGHVRPNVCRELHRLPGFALEAGAGHSLMEHMRKIEDHILRPEWSFFEFYRARMPAN